MVDVLFYHLERAPVEQVLPTLLEKTLERGWKALVKVGPEASLQALDELLWTYREESFLPHGLVDDVGPENQPVLLGTGDERPNRADVLFLVADAAPPVLDGYERCVDLFNGRDEASVRNARLRYRAARDAGHDVTYWQQTPEGRWQQKA